MHCHILIAIWSTRLFFVSLNNIKICNAMKSRKITTFSIFLFALLLMDGTGCRKELTITVPAPVVENPLELTVSNNFDWKTTRDITLEVTGITVPVSIRNTLWVKSTDEEKVYLKNPLFMDQNYTLKFTIPAYETEVMITYGSIWKIVDATPEVIHFNYLSQ